METLPNGLVAYVAGEGTRSVVVASDIFGIHTGRLKEICDELASEGYLVVMPDFFDGAYTDEGTSPPLWKRLLQAPAMVTPFTTPWSSVQRNLEEGVLPYLRGRGCMGSSGILGFCWGAWVVFKACAELPGAFACGASAHPSVSGMAARWGEDEDAIVRKVRAPQLVLSSADEPERWRSGGAVARLLRESAAESGGQDPGHAVRDFGSMKHGFVSRGDVEEPAVAAEIARAMDYIKGFLGKHILQAAT